MYIGVDAGTSIIKAVAFDSRGEVLASARRPVATNVPAPGWAEHDLEAILADTGAVVRDVARAGGEPVDVLALTAQGDGLWLTNAGGRAVRPPIQWADSRAAAIVDRWNADGTATAAFRINGGVPFSGCAAPLLTWLANHEPESLRRARTAGSLGDALTQHLTGERATDISNASLPFLDPATREYSPGLLALYGLNEFRSLLPPIDPSPGTTRPLSPTGAGLTGLPAGTPVHSGPFDFPASMLGSGVNRLGDGLLAFGTTLACGVAVDRLHVTGEPSGMTLCLPDQQTWVRLLPAMAGTLALDWLLPLLGVAFGDLDALLAASEPGASGLLVLPFLSPAGERAPFVDSRARGRILGLSTAHGRPELVRAVCEGIAMAARHCFDEAGLAIDGTITIAGGGTRSSQLLRLLAAVLGSPLRLARQPEPGARGAVIAALRAAGIAFDVESWTRPDGVVAYDDTIASLYDDRYRAYRAELDRARATWCG